MNDQRWFESLRAELRKRGLPEAYCERVLLPLPLLATGWLGIVFGMGAAATAYEWASGASLNRVSGLRFTHGQTEYPSLAPKERPYASPGQVTASVNELSRSPGIASHHSSIGRARGVAHERRVAEAERA